MGKQSKIEWTDHTFNPWIGCTKVSPGCEHCYAQVLMEGRMKRVKWGPGQPRSRTSEGNWRKPIAWNREARLAGVRARVFCASLADFLDPEVSPLWLADLLVLIDSTPHLDWLLLSKRPALWRQRMEEVAEPFVAGEPDAHRGAEIAYDWAANGIAPANVWVGCTVEDQRRADERLPALIKIPARVRFLSCEPLLESIDVSFYLAPNWIHWVIAGGESGQGARPMHPAWATSLRDQCDGLGVPFLFKQWGAWAPTNEPNVLRGTARTTIGIDGAPTALDPVDAITLDRVGKKVAGRLLAGVTHDGLPVLA